MRVNHQVIAIKYGKASSLTRLKFTLRSNLILNHLKGDFYFTSLEKFTGYYLKAKRIITL